MSGDRTVDGYVSGLNGWRSDAVRRICEEIQAAAPDANGLIKWAQPVYELNGPFVWVKAFGRHVTFGFWRGAQLPDPHGVLEGDGRRMRHVRIGSLEELRPEVVREYAAAAAELNRRYGDPTRQE